MSDGKEGSFTSGKSTLLMSGILISGASVEIDVGSDELRKVPSDGGDEGGGVIDGRSIFDELSPGSILPSVKSMLKEGAALSVLRECERYENGTNAAVDPTMKGVNLINERIFCNLSWGFGVKLHFSDKMK
jgi:hypothetical protein